MPALFRCVYGWCHEVWPSKKAPFVNNNLCWPRPTEKPFFSSLGLAVALYNCTQQTCGPEQKKRPNPSIACCINCPKKSFGENWGKRKHNQMQVEQRWSLQSLTSFMSDTQDFLFERYIHFERLSSILVQCNITQCMKITKKMSRLSLMNLWILMNFVNFCNLINLWIWWIF